MFRKRWIVNAYDVNGVLATDAGSTITRWGAERVARRFPAPVGVFGPLYDLRVERIA